jgi:hypothetical protein
MIVTTYTLRFAQSNLNVQENMFDSQNGQSQTQYAQSKPRGKYTGERIPPAKLQAIVNALAIGEPIEHIAARLHSSTQSVIATRERESLDITRRKELIRASAARLAANGFNKLNREMDAGNINGALLVPVTGMAIDKVIALSSDPSPQQNLHLYLQPRDVTGEFNSLLHKLQEKARALRDAEALSQAPPPALSDERTDTGQPSNLTPGA